MNPAAQGFHAAAAENAERRLSAFEKWLNLFVDEKGLDVEELLEVEGASGTNFMPLQIVLDAIKGAPRHEQDGIKNMIVRIDFAAAPVLPYFKHLARALAI